MLGKLKYSRYQSLLKNGDSATMPHININERSTDKVVIWDNNSMDRLSFKYYQDPRYGWIILMANPQFTMEFDIPKTALIRIPYPLDLVRNEIEEKINNFSKNN